MATPKKKTPTPKRSTPKRSTPKPAPAPSSESATAADRTHLDLSAVRAMHAALPALRPHARAAFMNQFSNERCERTGGATRGVDVRREAAFALRGIAQEITTHQASLRYSTERLAFLFECLFALDDALTASRATLQSATARKATLANARAVVLQDRTALLLSLSLIAGERDADTLAQARGLADSNDNLVASTEALLALYRTWLAQDARRPLFDSHGIAAPVLASIEQHTTQLRAAMGTEREQAAPRATDSPAVNVAEGRLILELGQLDAAIEGAREQKTPIKSLLFGDTLRRAVRNQFRKPAKPTPPDDGNGEGKDPEKKK
jgi:hypothetical protein